MFAAVSISKIFWLALLRNYEPLKILKMTVADLKALLENRIVLNT